MNCGVFVGNKISQILVTKSSQTSYVSHNFMSAQLLFNISNYFCTVPLK